MFDPNAIYSGFRASIDNGVIVITIAVIIVFVGFVVWSSRRLE